MADKSSDTRDISLAQFVCSAREHVGLSKEGLAKKCNLQLADIQNIESGIELFLSSTVRQKLAKGLKLNLHDIKKYEKNENFKIASNATMAEIKDRILNGDKEIPCPVCGQILITRIAKLYDLEDNLTLNPKARCPKCPFQLKCDY